MARGRDLLRGRLQRRGVGSLGALAAEAVPAALYVKTLGLLAGAAVPAPVAALAAGTLRGMTMTPLRTTAVLLLSIVLLGGGLALLGAATRPARPPVPAVTTAPAPAGPPRDAQGDPLPRGAVARLGSTRPTARAWPWPATSCRCGT
jgi:hypothetical protein